MTTALEERIAREEARGEQQDTRLIELREDMRTGFERVDRAIVSETTSIREDMRAGFDRTDRTIAEVREDMRTGFDRVDRSLVAETTSIREDMRAGFDRVDRNIEGLRSEFNTFRNLMIGGMITLGIGMIVLFLTIILRPPG